MSLLSSKSKDNRLTRCLLEIRRFFIFINQNFMKKLFVIFSLGVLLLSPFLSLADNNSAIQYLQTQTQNPWITQSLAAANQQNLSTDYINAQEQDLMKVAKYLLVLSAVNSEDYASMRTLFATLSSHFNNGQFGDQSQLNDDFWGLLAAGAVNKAGDFNSVKDFIISHQNADGGWSWATSGTSDSNDTAAAIMALKETDISSQDQVIVNALNYLHTTQKTDGGFAYDATASSDGASTAWVVAALNKLDIDVATWNQGDNTPLSFLNSLQQADGSFLWLPSDAQGSSMVTAYALLAILDKSYPVNRVNIPAENNGNGNGNSQDISLRIEGPANTICLAEHLTATNVLALVVEASSACNFTYQITETEYGPYLSEIAGFGGQGLNGWQYWLNWQPGTQSADQAQIQGQDEVLWAYGQFSIKPSKVEASVDGSGHLSGHLQYFDQTWQDLAQATINIGGQNYVTNAQGLFSVDLTQNGAYPVYFNGSEAFIRSNKIYLNYGVSSSNQSLDLSVNVVPTGEEENDQISFFVSQNQINFGDLERGQIGETILQLTNSGNVGITLEANILGDSVLIQNTTLNNQAWADFGQNLNIGQNANLNVRLSVPNTASFGQHQGQLIFWASAR